MQKRNADIRLFVRKEGATTPKGGRPLFSGPLIINTGFDKARGQAVLASGDAGPHPTSSNGFD
jgi:hypothetical protein